MAGDWIKFDVTTPDKPEVWAIAGILDIDPDAVVGKLLRVWAWFDQHTESGNAPSVTKKLLDRIVGVTGFCDAVIDSGWMIEEGNSIALPNFEVHNGKTAKKRALTAKRVAEHKEKKRFGNAEANAEGNAPSVTSALPREEKNKNNNNTPQTPRNRGALTVDQQRRFDRFWSVYPLKKSKGQAEKAFAKINPDDLLIERMLRAIDQQSKHRDLMTRSGQFVPPWKHPSTWLNARSWEDELEPVQGIVQQSTGPLLKPFPMDE